MCVVLHTSIKKTLIEVFPKLLIFCPFAFCNEVTFDLYGKNFVYLYASMQYFYKYVLNAYVKHIRDIYSS